MITHYRKTLLSLFAEVKRLSSDPSGHRQLALSIQKTLIRKISAIERRMHALRRERDKLRKEYCTSVAAIQARGKRIQDLVRGDS